jgi:hypothetical protein
MISLAADETDNRVKYVQPTALANRYFAQMGQCIEQARTS